METPGMTKRTIINLRRRERRVERLAEAESNIMSRPVSMRW
jgi:hypothetical protein